MPKLWRNMDGQQVAARIMLRLPSQRYRCQSHGTSRMTSRAKSSRFVVFRLRLSQVGKVSLPSARTTYVTAIPSISRTLRTWFVAVTKQCPRRIERALIGIADRHPRSWIRGPDACKSPVTAEAATGQRIENAAEWQQLLTLPIVFDSPVTSKLAGGSGIAGKGPDEVPTTLGHTNLATTSGYLHARPKLAAVKERAMGERWLPKFIGMTIGIVIIASLAIGVIFLPQSVGASGRILIAIGVVAWIADLPRGTLTLIKRVPALSAYVLMFAGRYPAVPMRIGNCFWPGGPKPRLS